jgi:hypothetical protein
VVGRVRISNVKEDKNQCPLKPTKKKIIEKYFIEVLFKRCFLELREFREVKVPQENFLLRKNNNAF